MIMVNTSWSITGQSWSMMGQSWLILVILVPVNHSSSTLQQQPLVIPWTSRKPGWSGCMLIHSLLVIPCHSLDVIEPQKVLTYQFASENPYVRQWSLPLKCHHGSDTWLILMLGTVSISGFKGPFRMTPNPLGGSKCSECMSVDQ